MSGEANDHVSSIRDPRPRPRSILLLVDDDDCRELLLDVLGSDLPVTIASTRLEARRLVGEFTYRLVIVTSFGLPVEAALSVVAADHTYPALLISGPLDDRLRHECTRRRIRLLEAPFGAAELREALAASLR